MALTTAQAGAAGLIVATLPPATQGGDLVTGPDEAIWFTGRYGEEHEGEARSFIGRLDAAGEVTEFPLPGEREAGTLVAGPRESIWFSEADNAEGYGVGRMSVSGELQEYTFGGEGGFVSVVAASGDDLWAAAAFTEPAGIVRRSLVERIATAPDLSVAQEIPLRRPCSASAIVARGDSVWFAESCSPRRSANPTWSARIVQVKPTGELVRWQLPPLAFIESLAIGPDGSIWFGSFGAGGRRVEFGRISPSGRLDGYRVPDGDPSTMAIGPEGRLWFRSSFGGNVYRGLNSLGPRGHIGKPICAGPSCKLEVNGLTTGPEGNLWFSATEAHAPYGGGGGGAQLERNLRANEPGVIGLLTLPPPRAREPLTSSAAPRSG